ncbi:hypothetical protein I050019G5_12860 [Collinsella sp. i05-0019-G5]|uniref:hypothetical protein n=1 Tax=Collinsella sp. i05-0019-G5 TaxID=3132705 RepID=UPI0036F33C25
MANLVTFAKKLWKDKVGGNTPITAAELNRMEGGINDCATQINKLGDSVSLHRTALINDRIRFEWKTKDGNNGLHVYVDKTLVAFIRQNTGL